MPVLPKYLSPHGPHLRPLVPRQGSLPAPSQAGVLGAAVGAGRAGQSDGLAAAASHGRDLMPAASG